MSISSEFQAKLIQKQGVRIALQDKLKLAMSRKADADKHLIICQDTQKVVHEMGNYTLAGLSVQVNTIVSNAIKAILPDPYDFELNFDVKYNKLNTNMKLTRRGETYDPAKEDNGDGLVDIIALTLRVAVLCLDKRKLSRILILDEPCGALSVNFHPLAASLIRHLSDSLGIQFIIIAAHGSNYTSCADKMFDSADFIEGAVL